MAALERFKEVFVGGEQAHGRWDEKRGARTDKGAAPPEAYQEHLAGTLGLGLVPVRADGTCRFGAIDIDDRSINHQVLLQHVQQRRLPLIVCRSKRGGAHLYLFFQEPGLPAGQAQHLLKRWATVLGFPKAEIFPKQIKVGPRNLGNWINLPYFGGDQTTRYAVAPKGTLTLEEFLAAITFYNPDLSQVDESVAKDLEQFPPCLRALMQLGLPEGQRNKGLFNFGVFFRKAFPNNWKEKLIEFNQQHVVPPLPYAELESTVIRSLSNKNYQYMCREEPIVSHCDRDTCLKLPFGVGYTPWEDDAGVYDALQLSRLRKLDTDPPQYVVELSGHDLTLTSEQFLDYKLFRRRALERLDLMLPRIKTQTWDKLIKELLGSKEDLPAPPDASVEGQVLARLHDFLALRSLSRDTEDLLKGLPVTREDRVLFRAEDFKARLVANRLDKPWDMGRVYLLFKSCGGEHARLRILGKHFAVWSFPVAAINAQTEAFSGSEEELGGLPEEEI